MSLKALAARTYCCEVAHGFWEGLDPTNVHIQLSKLALIVSEAAEAMEEARVGNIAAMGPELADIIIRTLNLAVALGIDIGAEVEAKALKNESRPYRHGNKLA